uniref:Uncharacterized protein n=1 Tax=Chromera velia CCMP2878 TaxID=1169474 RepID=A0A0G4G5K1_9ALVE|eukprot:Cvel_20285.t1-p1 / transcript=Cvel_20285.t1 / gene=Cvel_20285 / organism=Chromera_velia_CCMP2878 / gene_product=hypothetical protein / transcript_product=hypothetical protein / location=Cvel_scaffold1811:9904-12312(-) / protein_length=387 / sequence_SO=supercontig / SO=protein_coding / is_pseudo=false
MKRSKEKEKGEAVQSKTQQREENEGQAKGQERDDKQNQREATEKEKGAGSPRASLSPSHSPSPSEPRSSESLFGGEGDFKGNFRDVQRRRKGGRDDPWSDHFFGHSLAFSPDCSLLAVGEPGTDDNQGVVVVYRVTANDTKVKLASSPKLGSLVFHSSPPFSGSSLSWHADPLNDTVTVFSEEKLKMTIVPPKSVQRSKKEGNPLFGFAVSSCSLHLNSGSSPSASSQKRALHFLVASAPANVGERHGNVYAYILTAKIIQQKGGDGRIRKMVRCHYELVQDLGYQGGVGPFVVLQRITLKDAGGFGEARMGDSVHFLMQKEAVEATPAAQMEQNLAETETVFLQATEQRQGEAAYILRMDGDKWKAGLPAFVPATSSFVNFLTRTA